MKTINDCVENIYGEIRAIVREVNKITDKDKRENVSMSIRKDFLKWNKILFKEMFYEDKT